MSRTTLTVMTATALAVLSLGLMVGRYILVGDEIVVPRGPGTWKVTMKVTGVSTAADARVTTATPLDFGRQHILREKCHSAELVAKPPTARHPDRRQVTWSPRAGKAPGHFQAYYEFYCAVDVVRPTASMAQLARAFYAAPAAEKGTVPLGKGTVPFPALTERRVDCDHADISALARRLTTGLEGASDQAEALYHFVDRQIANEPTIGRVGEGVAAVVCLRAGAGDPAAKSRLLVALCRNRGIPARLVTGLRLARTSDEAAHVWAEAWIRDQWLPMCPFYHHFGRVPATYLVFSFGAQPLIRGRGVRDLDYACLVEHTAPKAAGRPGELGDSWLKRWIKRCSLDALPPAEQHLVEFLLLLPVAALIVCVYRNIIGVTSYGTFAPALVGLAFRELHGLPGMLVFVAIVLLGWGMRRLLDRFHLLQVPRTAFLLSLVVVVLVLAVVAANLQSQPIAATRYIPLFPMVILTGMIERFWTLEVEDGTSSAFRTLLGTMLIAGTVALVLSWQALARHVFLFPETVGMIMAGQLVIGRYTGYRLSELFRFRDLVRTAEA